MKHNVGGVDRGVRVVAGIALLGLTLANVIGPWGWIGVIPLATGLMGVCPLYPVFGLSTCKK